MRKALIITMLLLMFMTSLNAGTLAIYTSTVELKAVPIAAKRFVLDVGRGSADEFDLWIAPGDTVSYYINISNSSGEGRQSEVDMDLVIEADFSSVYQALPGILISLTEAGLQVGAADGSGRLSYSQSKAFTASVPDEKEPQGRGKIAVLSAILGLFVGITLAFVCNFWQTAEDDPETKEKKARLRALLGRKSA